MYNKLTNMLTKKRHTFISNPKSSSWFSEDKTRLCRSLFTLSDLQKEDEISSYSSEALRCSKTNVPVKPIEEGLENWNSKFLVCRYENDAIQIQKKLNGDKKNAADELSRLQIAPALHINRTTSIQKEQKIGVKPLWFTQAGG